MRPLHGRVEGNYWNIMSFMFHSASRQGASFQNPRAIAFKPRGNVVMAFNGNKTQKGGNQVEFMEFDRERREVSFF